MTGFTRRFVTGKRRYGLLAASTLFVMLAYVAMAAVTNRAGFPLDDAWIHQTYARSLVESGRWEYVPGQVSAGSTAPLWTLGLTISYWIRLSYLSWAYVLGGLSLFGLGLASMRLWRQLRPEKEAEDWMTGLVIVFTWPLVWAAASGMETVLFAAVGLWIVVFYLEYRATSETTAVVHPRPTRRTWPIVRLGLLSGLLILIRPDGLVLLGLIAAGLSLGRASVPDRVGVLFIYGGVLCLPLIPYLVFNLQVSGHIWPNTFYAKQAEYAVLLDQPLLARLGRLLFFSLGGPETGWRGFSGAHLFLLPGLLLGAWGALKKDVSERQLCYSLPLLWAAGHIVLYSWRLPVTYQHGRYLAAALPIWILYGLSGWPVLLDLFRSNRANQLVRKVASLSFLLLLFLMWLLGAQAYATDVALIEGEMVNVALWLDRNTPPNALIAAHDIGAIGYFTRRPLVDLAGLISPEIISRLDDEVALADFILASDASYLVTAPGWTYERVTRLEAVVPMYTTDFKWTLEQGLNNMTVYRLPAP